MSERSIFPLKIMFRAGDIQGQCHTKWKQIKCVEYEEGNYETFTA